MRVTASKPLALRLALRAAAEAVQIPSYAEYAAPVRESFFAVMLERPEYRLPAPSARAPVPEFSSSTLLLRVPVAE